MFLIRSDTNWAVQPQTMIRGLKFSDLGSIIHVPVLGHCIATWYARSRYLVKLMELETSWGRGDTAT